MDINFFISFVFVSALVIAVPGPNVLLVISTSVSHGVTKGLLTVLGTSSAMVLQLLVVALGTEWFVGSLVAGFETLRWLGVGYLLYLGVSHIYRAVMESDQKAAELSNPNTYVRGFFVSLSNPKTMLFFGAFLPQFISSEAHYLQQFALLSVTFLILATILDSLYAILASKLRYYLEWRRMYVLQHGISGVMFIGASAWLALMRRG